MTASAKVFTVAWAWIAAKCAQALNARIPTEHSHARTRKRKAMSSFDHVGGSMWKRQSIQCTAVDTKLKQDWKGQKG